MRKLTIKPNSIGKAKCIHSKLLKNQYIIEILDKKLDTKGKNIRYMLRCLTCGIKWKYYTPIDSPIKDFDVILYI